MATAVRKNAVDAGEIRKLRVKAALLDDLMDLIEDKYLGQLMSLVEKEKNIPLSKARKSLG